MDASGYADHICDLLPLHRSFELGYPDPGFESEETVSSAGDKPAYVSCSRIPPDSPILDIDLYLTEDLLAYEYEMSKNTSIGGTNEPWLEPLTIAGQPAAALGRSHMTPNTGCTVVVGLTDTQSVRVHASQQFRDPRGYNDGHGDGRACEHAMAVADAIVRNLGG